MRIQSRQIRQQRQAKQARRWGNLTKENARAGVDPVWALNQRVSHVSVVPSRGPLQGTTGKAPTDRGFAHRQTYLTDLSAFCLPLPAFSVGPKKSNFSRINIMTTESNSQVRIEALQNALKGVSALVSAIGPQIVAMAKTGYLALETPWGCSDLETLARLLEALESSAESLVSEVESLARDAGCPVQDPRAEARHAARFAARDDREGWE